MINEYRATLILSIMTLTITVVIFVSMILSSLFLFFNIYSNHHLTLCFSESCFKYAITLFSTPLYILKQSLIFIPVFVFFIGLYNFKLSLVNSKLNNCMNKERDFYSYIKENSFKEKEIFESLNKKKLFSALFMNDLKFNLQAKVLIKSFYQNRASYGLLSLIKDEKKEAYKNNLLTISTFFGMTLEEEIDIDRMDEIVDLLCCSVKEIILIWFSINIDNK
ncbi:retron Ec48 family effector membrane protein [Erwinia amylovora]|uniref:retron Ec48 family effector membrane protein n=3 Tax=Erwinia amylovora TaxID=552 RepID=UPI0014440BB2